MIFEGLSCSGLNVIFLHYIYIEDRGHGSKIILLIAAEVEL